MKGGGAKVKANVKNLAEEEKNRCKGHPRNATECGGGGRSRGSLGLKVALKRLTQCGGGGASRIKTVTPCDAPHAQEEEIRKLSPPVSKPRLTPCGGGGAARPGRSLAKASPWPRLSRYSMVGIRLVSGWYQVGGRLVSGWYQVGIRLVSGSYQVGIRLVSGSYQVGSRLVSGWYQVGIRLVVGW